MPAISSQQHANFLYVFFGVSLRMIFPINHVDNEALTSVATNNRLFEFL